MLLSTFQSLPDMFIQQCPAILVAFGKNAEGKISYCSVQFNLLVPAGLKRLHNPVRMNECHVLQLSFNSGMQSER